MSDFSGLAISAWALASAAASAPILLLDRCMARLLSENVKADRAGLRAFGADAMAEASLASSGTRAFSSVFDRSWSEAACRVA